MNIAQTQAHLDRGRYRRVMRFFVAIALDIVWWEVLLRRLLGRARVGRGRARRFQRYARNFRTLATRMGGVMIKLGQFISARVDVIPPEITSELADLQDAVPPEPLDAILLIIEQELGAPADQVFRQFDSDVLAAASLGQVHRAHLQSGEPVVVKVQRPHIEDKVSTDLAALRVVARWTMLWSVIRRRANVPALMEEFASTLWEELDYEKEAGNADRFRDLFAGDPGVYIPLVYQDTSTRCVLTLEDVYRIKIGDSDTIRAAGVDVRQVAHRLMNAYLRMIFEFSFFHADPHPGNLFVEPLPIPPDAVPDESTPFRLIFVDFGMVGHISERTSQGLREMLIAVSTRDARRVLEAYQMLGVLLPSADLSRIEEVEAEILEYVWGKSVPELARMSRADMSEFLIRYRDLLYQMPFQVPQNFIYLGRAVGTLSGMCTGLDPEFNPWEPMAHYAEKLLAREGVSNWRDWLDEAVALAQVTLGLPRQLQDVLGRIQRGNVVVEVQPDSTLQRDLLRLESAATGISRAVVFVGLLVVATLLYLNQVYLPAYVGYGLAGITWLLLVFQRRQPGGD